MLLRRFAIDKDKGKKLSPRWEGPYSIYKIGKSGVSVTLRDIQTDKVKGGYSIDSVKIYVPRERRKEEGTEEEPVAMSTIKGRRYCTREVR